MEESSWMDIHKCLEREGPSDATQKEEDSMYNHGFKYRLISIYIGDIVSDFEAFNMILTL